jgi:hypothetical protein
MLPDDEFDNTAYPTRFQRKVPLYVIGIVVFVLAVAGVLVIRYTLMSPMRLVPVSAPVKQSEVSQLEHLVHFLRKLQNSDPRKCGRSGLDIGHAKRFAVIPMSSGLAIVFNPTYTHDDNAKTVSYTVINEFCNSTQKRDEMRFEHIDISYDDFMGATGSTVHSTLSGSRAICWQRMVDLQAGINPCGYDALVREEL